MVIKQLEDGTERKNRMETSIQVKQEVTSSIINRLREVLDENQTKELKIALDIELYKINMSRETTEVAEYDNTYLKKLEMFLIAKRIEGRTEGTIQRYKDLVYKFLVFFNKNVEEITTEDIRYYLAWYKKTRGVSFLTLDGMRLGIRSFFNWLYQEKYIDYNPTDRIKKIKFEKKVKQVITDENLELMREACRTERDYAMMEFLYATGIRIGEFVKLNISDIDFNKKKAVINGKGNKQRIICINGRAIIRLKKYLEKRKDSEEALFVTLNKPHRRLSKGGARAVIKKIAKKANIDQNVFPHAFRTKFASDMSRHGAPLEHVQKLLGHENINTTCIYAIASDETVANSYSQFMY